MDEQTAEVLLALSPGLVPAILLLLLFFVFLLISPRHHEEDASRLEGSALLPSAFIRYFYWLTGPIARGLSAVGIRPNHITAFSVFLAICTGAALAVGQFMLATWIFVIAVTCDLLDGLAARSQNIQSPSGAFFDSWADRATEGAVLGGLAIYGTNSWLLVLSIWALVASYLVSYARARGESLGVQCKIGLMQRPERMLLLAFSLFFSPILAIWLEPGAERPIYHAALVGTGILAVLGTITSIRRARWIIRALDSRASAATPTKSAEAKTPSATETVS